ncbi:MAG: hypothetical protein KKA67_05695 [Spirochaetes bacterium]|nr:hypothetical protein [Spirochaetota bacterium]MBU1080271.1 hypothetical protein [Spirochaetota bacterium]
MSDGKGRRAVLAVLVSVVVILLYFFVFAEPLSPELSAVPRWKTDIDVLQAAAASAPAAEPIAFSAGDRFGYFYPDGRLSFIAEAAGGAPVSDASYVSLEAAGGDRVLKRPDGATIASIESRFPFYSGGRLFSAEKDGSGVAAYDSAGRAMWEYAFPCQLSAFSAGDGLVVGGTVDGWLEGVSLDGRRAFSFAPGGSRLPVVLGIGVSRSGDWVASVSGVDKQRLVVLGRGGVDYRVASHRYLDTDYREPVRVVVLDDDKHVLYRRSDGIGVWSVDGSVDEVLPVKADDFDVALDGSKGIAYLVARRGRKSEIVAFRLPATLLGRIALPDYSEYARFSGSSAFVGGKTWLARLDFMEE